VVNMNIANAFEEAKRDENTVLIFDKVNIVVVQ
jgi:hypothetical protein